MIKPASDDALEAHLRTVLSEVAARVDLDPTPARGPVGLSAGSRRRSRRAVGTVAAVTVVVAGLAAWNTLGDGEIDRIPTETAIQSGITSSGDWWLIPALHQDGCGNPFPGVEIVTSDRNRPGAEWDTAGVAYGEPPADTGCFEFDEGSWLRDPSLFDYGRTRSGHRNDPSSEWITALAVHPNVAVVEVSIDDSSTFAVRTVNLPDRPEGPRFVAFTAPNDAAIIDIALVDDSGNKLGQRTDLLR